MKTCSGCKRLLSLEDFSKDKNSKDGRHNQCKKCKSAYSKTPVSRASRARYARTPAGKLANRRGRLKYNYGLTLEEYNELVDRQGGRCATCGKAARLYIDHDHRCCPGQRTCGACVRGLLCDNCNKGIGNLQDDPLVLRAAAAYLEQHGRYRMGAGDTVHA